MESEACQRTLYATTDMAGLLAGLGGSAPDSREEPRDTLLVFRFLLCVTDDEWQRLHADDDPVEFSTSALRCLDERMGILLLLLSPDNYSLLPAFQVAATANKRTGTIRTPPSCQGRGGLWCVHAGRMLRRAVNGPAVGAPANRKIASEGFVNLEVSAHLELTHSEPR